MEIQSDLNNQQLMETIRNLVEANYDLGELTQVKDIFGGFCNRSYAVWMSANGRTQRYFLRLYNGNVIENEILFEHALLNHLRSNGFMLAAVIVPCRNGSTVVHTPLSEDPLGNTALWGLFQFLEGEDEYSWTNTDLTDEEFVSAAEVLAQLHNCGHGFEKPEGADRAQPPIMKFIPNFKDTYAHFLNQAVNRRCDRLFKDNFESICTALDKSASQKRFREMPKIPIHCDYHPGNLKYCAGKCSGIFDFDWSKIDYRLFDVALGLVYFTSIWNGAATGLRQDKFTLFLSAYNQACRQSVHMEPLIDQERACLVDMLSIANLYVLNWDLVDFYTLSAPDDEEYGKFSEHNIGLMHWIELHRGEIELWIRNSN